MSLQDSLQKIVEMDPAIEFLDLSNQGITSFTHELLPYLSHLPKIKELNLEANMLTALPKDCSLLFPHLQNLNLNGNDLTADQFSSLVHSLKTVPQLKSLYINLHQEEQVDQVMRALESLEYLNGLPVERDILDDESGEAEQAEMESNGSETDIVKVQKKEQTSSNMPPENDESSDALHDSGLAPSEEAAVFKSQRSNNVVDPVVEIPEQEDMTESMTHNSMIEHHSQHNDTTNIKISLQQLIQSSQNEAEQPENSNERSVSAFSQARPQPLDQNETVMYQDKTSPLRTPEEPVNGEHGQTPSQAEAAAMDVRAGGPPNVNLVSSQTG